MCLCVTVIVMYTELCVSMCYSADGSRDDHNHCNDIRHAETIF